MRFSTSRALLALVAVLAIGAVSASAASALPEFKPVPTKKKFTSAGGAVKFKAAADVLECSESTAAGEITGSRAVGKVTIKFTGCNIPGGGGGKCSVRSVGAKEGEIVTKALKGELGTVSTVQAPSGVGLLLQPEEAKKWATLVSGCLGETAWTGSVAAEVPIIGKKQATNKLVIATKEGRQAIEEIKLDSGTIAKPEFVIWSFSWTMETTDELAFEEALEVT